MIAAILLLALVLVVVLLSASAAEVWRQTSLEAEAEAQVTVTSSGDRVTGVCRVCHSEIIVHQHSAHRSLISSWLVSHLHRETASYERA